MYADRILLPPISNREDLLRTVSLFDDDTGAAIDFSGRTLAAPGDFTANAWTVTAGGIVTASVTQLTIKDYPINNEMIALALSVAPNLAIAAGTNVTIADATGKNSMSGYVTSYAPTTGAMVAQIGSQFEFEIRSGSHRGDGYGDGYGPSSLIGSDGGYSHPVISAQLGNGLTMIGLGVLQVRIPASTIQKLHAKTYGAALAMFDGSDTRQIFIGELPVLQGGVRMMPLPLSNPANPYGLP